MNTTSLIAHLPKALQVDARNFMKTKEFPGPKTSVADSSPDQVLLDSETRIAGTIALDNSPVDKNRAVGAVETEDLKVAYQEGENGLEFFSESVGNGPYRLVSLSQSNSEGMNTVLALTDPTNSVISAGAIHLNRASNQESFVAGDLKGLPFSR